MMNAELQSSADAILTALVRIEETCGAVVAGQAAELMIRLGGCFMFARIGPVAAKAALIGVYADLETDIEAANSGSGLLS
jgi:hypothetical protein